MAVTHWRSTCLATFGSLEVATPSQNSSVLQFLFISPFLWVCSRAGSRPFHSLIHQKQGRAPDYLGAFRFSLQIRADIGLKSRFSLAIGLPDEIPSPSGPTAIQG